MKKYNPQVYTYAVSKLNKMINVLRSAKKDPDTISVMCEQYDINEESIYKFLDDIENEYADMLENTTSFDKLIFDNVFRKPSLQPLINMHILSLEDLTKITFNEFLNIPLRTPNKIKLLSLMIEHNLAFKDSTMDEMEQRYAFATALVK